MARPLRLFFLAAFGWWIAAAVDLETHVELVVWSDHVEWSAAGTTVAAEFPVDEVTALSVRAQPGVFPIGGQRLEATTGDGPIKRWRLPGRFTFPSNPRPPTNDWWVDEFLTDSEVFRTEADLGSEFRVRAVFTGRSQQHISIVLRGSPGLECSFRRGLINNDIHLHDASGATLAHSSIDPRLADNLGGIAATLLRSAAAALLLLGVWRLIFRGRERNPAKEPKPHRAKSLLVFLLGVGAAASSILVSSNIFDTMPHLPDEVVLQLQARWLSGGRLTAEEPLCSEHFEIPFTYFSQGRWIGHYPPFWPMLLAIGLALGFPHLLPVLLRFAQVILIGMLGRRIAGPWAGVAAAAMAAVSPLATVLGGSTLGHIACATFLTTAIYLALPPPSASKTGPCRWLACGVAFGAAFGIRPLTAVACALPVGLYLLGEIRNGRHILRDILLVFSGGIMATVPTLATNAHLTGSPWSFPYSLAEGAMVSSHHLMFGVRNLDAILASLVPALNGWGWPWAPFAFVLGLGLAPAAIPFLTGRSTREERLLLAIATAVLLAHVVARAHGLHGFGPRYAFAACAPLWVLSASGFARLARIEGRRLPAASVLLALLISTSAATLVRRTELYRGYNDVTPELRIAASSLDTCSLILLPPDDWRGWAAAVPWLGDADLEGPIFAEDLGGNDDLLWCYPDRTIIRWNGECFEAAE